MLRAFMMDNKVTLAVFVVFCVVCLALFILQLCAAFKRRLTSALFAFMLTALSVSVCMISVVCHKVDTVDNFLKQYSVPVTILEDAGQGSAEGTGASDSVGGETASGTEQVGDTGNASGVVTEESNANAEEGVMVEEQQGSVDSNGNAVEDSE